jgi:hypothetical protein
VTVAVYVPVVLPVQLRIDDPELAMLVGFKAHARPVEGETDEVRVTVPLKPFNAATVIVEVGVEPMRAVMLVGLEVIVKSVMLTVTVAVWDREPLLPVTPMA